MTALDLSPWVEVGDPPVLREYKKRVLEVAKNHSQRHHCGSINEIMHQLDLAEREITVRVQVKTEEGWEFVLDVTPDDLADMEEDEQKVYLADLFADKVDSKVGFKIRIPPHTINEMTVVSKTPAQIEAENGWDEETQRFWLYTSREGRVLHAYETSRAAGVYTSYMNSECMRAETNAAAVRSNRAENRRCTTCESRLAAS